MGHGQEPACGVLRGIGISEVVVDVFDVVNFVSVFMIIKNRGYKVIGVMVFCKGLG